MKFNNFYAKLKPAVQDIACTSDLGNVLEATFPDAEIDNLTGGIYRQVFGVYSWVVKTRDERLNEFMKHVPYKRIRELGLVPPRVWYPSKYVMVQPRYVPLYDSADASSPDIDWYVAGKFDLDVHNGNIGVNKRGQLVLYDW